MSHNFAKRHYEAIASAIQEAKRRVVADLDGSAKVGAIAGINLVILELADTFAGDNGQFSRDRFERACVPGANVRARS